METSGPGAREQSTVRPAAILLGLVLTVVNALWVLDMERVHGAPFPSTISLFLNCVFTLIVVQAANALVRRAVPKWALRQAELIVVYTMTAIGTGIAGVDGLSIAPQMAADPIQMATPGNRWASVIWPHLPAWLTVQDLAALRGYYEGNSSLYLWPHLRAWMVPAAAWVLFTVVLLWVMLCLNVLVRRQWQDHERLTYPLTQLPIEMTRPGGALYRFRPFLLGAAAAGAIDLVNGLALWNPSLPSLSMWGPDIATFLPSRPWNAIWWMPLNYFPFVLGMGFLLPVDLLFSCWFFYLVWKAERVIFDSGGWSTASNFPYINEQCLGGYVAIVAFALWAGRATYGRIVRRALGREEAIDDRAEGLGYRTAFWGAVGGTLFLMAFLILAGLAWWVAVLFFAVFWVLMFAVARIRAELGPPVHDLHFTGPDHMLPAVLGTRNLDGRTMAVLSLSFWFNRAYRSSPMPVQAEGLAMAHRLGADQRRMVAAMLLAGAVGAVAVFWGCLHNAYTLGAQSKMRHGYWMGVEGFTRMQGWLDNPEGPSWGAIGAMGVGFLVSLGLMIAHTRFAYWPFHAMGFAISGSWSMNLVWFPLLLAWICKVLTIRYAGIRGYRVAMTFFLGLIVGEAVVGVGWTLVRAVTGYPIYAYF